MDEETKRLFDTILKEKSHASKAKDAYRLYVYADERERSRERERLETERLADAFTSLKGAGTRKPKPITPTPTPSEEYNTHDHIAVLSVNQAKACIVFRAPTNNQVRNEIARLGNPEQVKYNKQDGVWELHPAILPGIKLVLKTHYKDVQVLGVQKQVQATKFDQLMARLSKDDKDKIYKLLALKYHPDKGGDKETMVLVNLVFKGGV